MSVFIPADCSRRVQLCRIQRKTGSCHWHFSIRAVFPIFQAVFLHLYPGVVFLHLKFLQFRPVGYRDRYRIVGDETGRDLNLFPEIASNRKLRNPVRGFLCGPFRNTLSRFFLPAFCSVLLFLHFPPTQSRKATFCFPQSEHCAFYISTIKR